MEKVKIGREQPFWPLLGENRYFLACTVALKIDFSYATAKMHPKGLGGATQAQKEAASSHQPTRAATLQFGHFDTIVAGETLL